MFSNLYKYKAGYWFNNEINKIVIRMGCFVRTIAEWGADFNNNQSEFPIGSPELKKREEAYQFVKEIAIKHLGHLEIEMEQNEEI
jgi:hypothetical protein